MNRLLIVTALMPEAAPLIDFYRMKKQPKQAHFHRYLAEFGNSATALELLVCGMGADKMRLGLTAYFAVSAQFDKNVYLNFGIAGALCEPLGALLWAQSVADTRIGLPEGLPEALPYTVQSLAKAGNNYQPGVLFDMEAQSWLQCIAKNAQQFAPNELFCAKVVSDNQSENGHEIDQRWVRSIVSENIAQLDKYINKLLETME